MDAIVHRSPPASPTNVTKPIPAFELTTQNHIAVRINAMNLKNRFRDIETDSGNRLHDLAPPNHGRPNSTHFDGTLVPVEEVAVDTVIGVKGI
jgi:hypothetical protein